MSQRPTFPHDQPTLPATPESARPRTPKPPSRRAFLGLIGTADGLHLGPTGGDFTMADLLTIAGVDPDSRGQ